MDTEGLRVLLSYVAVSYIASRDTREGQSLVQPSKPRGDLVWNDFLTFCRLLLKEVPRIFVLSDDKRCLKIPSLQVPKLITGSEDKDSKRIFFNWGRPFSKRLRLLPEPYEFNEQDAMESVPAKMRFRGGEAPQHEFPREGSIAYYWAFHEQFDIKDRVDEDRLKEIEDAIGTNINLEYRGDVTVGSRRDHNVYLGILPRWREYPVAPNVAAKALLDQSFPELEEKGKEKPGCRPKGTAPNIFPFPPVKRFPWLERAENAGYSTGVVSHFDRYREQFPKFCAALLANVLEVPGTDGQARRGGKTKRAGRLTFAELPLDDERRPRPVIGSQVDQRYSSAALPLAEQDDLTGVFVVISLPYVDSLDGCDHEAVMADLLRERLALVARDHSAVAGHLREYVLVTTNLGCDTVQVALSQLEEVGAESIFVVMDCDAILDHLSHCPWIWTMFGGSGLGFKICRASHAERLRNLLCGDALNRIPLDLSLEHPAIQDIRLEVSGMVRLVGLSGAGKSTALFQLVSRIERDALVMLVDHPDRQRFVEVLRPLMRELPILCVVVIDNLKDQCVESVNLILRDVWALREAGVDVACLVSYQQGERLSVETRYAALSLCGDPVQLDDAPRSFFEGLARSCSRSVRSANPSESEVHAIVEHVFEEYPAAISVVCIVVEWSRLGFLLDWRKEYTLAEEFRGLISRRDGIRAYWRNAFKRLESAAAQNLLLLVSGFWFCGLPNPRLDLVRLFWRAWVSESPLALARALETLAEQRWIRFDAGLLCSHEAQVGPDTLGLWTERGESEFLRSFIDEVLVQEDGFDGEEKSWIVWSIARHYEYRRQHDRSAKAYRFLRRRYPNLWVHHLWEGESHLRQGNYEDARWCFERMIKLDLEDDLVWLAVMRLAFCFGCLSLAEEARSLMALNPGGAGIIEKAFLEARSFGQAYLAWIHPDLKVEEWPSDRRLPRGTWRGWRRVRLGWRSCADPDETS